MDSNNDSAYDFEDDTHIRIEGIYARLGAVLFLICALWLHYDNQVDVFGSLKSYCFLVFGGLFSPFFLGTPMQLVQTGLVRLFIVFFGVEHSLYFKLAKGLAVINFVIDILFAYFISYAIFVCVFYAELTAFTP